MSWKAREKRIFDRLVKRLKAAPVYKLGSYVIIDADVVFLSKGRASLLLESKFLREASFLSYIHSGKIKTVKDFDSLYNPSLTLEVSFATSKHEANQIVCAALDEIAASWKARLYELGMKDNRLFRYYDVDEEEWSLEFVNAELPIDTIRDCCADVEFFIPERTS